MKNSLISLSIATILASSSMLANASSVTIPNTFTSGSSAVAADVNANFDALATGVNDNDSRVTINEGAITTNTTAIGTNTGASTANGTAIGTNTTAIGANTTAIGSNTTGVAGNSTSITTNAGNITTNAGNITTNSAAIATNVTDIATNTSAITALQSGQCPADMVSAGSFCIDLYEASVYEEASFTTQLDPTSASPGFVNITRCNVDGSDCGSSVSVPNTATAIFARSIAGVLPNASITWHQARLACANVGKRLPTLAEWQTAASGTDAGADSGIGGPGSNTNGDDCNTSDEIVFEKSNTGAFPACTSTIGAFDMIGNVFEWVADATPRSTGFVDSDDTANGLTVMVLGDDFDSSGGANSAAATTRLVAVLNGATGFTGENGTLTQNRKMGFRCAL